MVIRVQLMDGGLCRYSVKSGDPNDEGEEGAVTTVTFDDQGGKTLLTFHEIYPSREALEEAMQGSAAALSTQLDQLDALLSSKV